MVSWNMGSVSYETNCQKFTVKMLINTAKNSIGRIVWVFFICCNPRVALKYKNARPRSAKHHAQGVWQSCTDSGSKAHQQPRFGSFMQHCIRSLISTTNAQKYCKWGKVCASMLLWHFKTIWIENSCFPFVEVHCSNQQNLFHFACRGFS